MCFMITMLAAVITTIVWYFREDARMVGFGMPVLMYWGATLMWFVDGLFRVAEGEAFLELSTDDAALGFLVVICGMAAWMISVLLKDPKNVIRLQKTNR